MDTCCTFVLRDLDTAVVRTLTGRRLVHGPQLCVPYNPCYEEYTIYPKILLDPDEMMEVRHRMQPDKSRWMNGSNATKSICELTDPWEEFMPKKKCDVLDQDDYIIVRGTDGKRTVHVGPKIYSPTTYGEEVDTKGQAVLCPVNHYLVINDADSTTKPITHVRGPMKWYPEPFQTLTLAANGDQYHPCIEVTGDTAVHLQRATGEVELLDEPMFYMPEIGEKVVANTKRIVLLTTDFCIVKTPSGGVVVKSGQEKEGRSFFLKPFENLVTFNVGNISSYNKTTGKTILSTLPTFLAHKFHVRTTDNVVLDLDMRVNYRIRDLDVFSSNPIEFYTYIQCHVQNNLLDKFAQISLSQFMNSFGTVCESEVDPCNKYFHNFGIDIIALQIMHYECESTTTQDLLWQDIHTAVKQGNELRARQVDVYIQEQVNEVKRKQKNLEVALVNRDNEIRLTQKHAENTLRIREMDIEIQEERKRSDLLELKRGNDLAEAEYEGRARGHTFREFINGIGKDMKTRDKIAIFNKKCDLERTSQLYSKANSMNVYPTGVEVETYQVGSASDIHKKVSKMAAQAVNEEDEDRRSRGKERFKQIEESRKQERSEAKTGKDVMPGVANLEYEKGNVQVEGLGNTFRSDFSVLHDNAKINDNKDVLYKEHWKESHPSVEETTPSTNEPPPPPPKIIDESRQNVLKDRGDELFKQHKYREATIEYTKAIVLGEKGSALTIKCVNNRGLCYSKQNLVKDAMADCNYTLTYSPDEMKILLRKVGLIAEMRPKPSKFDVDEGLALCAQILELAGEKPTGKYFAKKALEIQEKLQNFY